MSGINNNILNSDLQLHVELGLEWYQSIGVAVILLRMLMFPVVIKSQRNMAHMNNNMPQMASLQVQSQTLHLQIFLTVIVGEDHRGEEAGRHVRDGAAHSGAPGLHH